MQLKYNENFRIFTQFRPTRNRKKNGTVLPSSGQDALPRSYRQNDKVGKQKWLLLQQNFTES